MDTSAERPTGSEDEYDSEDAEMTDEEEEEGSEESGSESENQDYKNPDFDPNNDNGDPNDDGEIISDDYTIQRHRDREVVKIIDSDDEDDKEDDDESIVVYDDDMDEPEVITEIDSEDELIQPKKKYMKPNNNPQDEARKKPTDQFIWETSSKSKIYFEEAIKSMIKNKKKISKFDEVYENGISYAVFDASKLKERCDQMQDAAALYATSLCYLMTTTHTKLECCQMMLETNGFSNPSDKLLCSHDSVCLNILDRLGKK